MLLIIDNYDSFTWNLYQYFCQCGVEVKVIRNDAITLQEMEDLGMSHLVISPGPCTPNEAGISLSAIQHFAGKLPILGVCLGHQAIAQAFGGKVIRAGQAMHGKTSVIRHNRQGLFSQLPDPLTVTRYHSLVVETATLPQELEMTAWVEEEDGRLTIMGLRHRHLEIESVQFHPESILSEQGLSLLNNFTTR
ncbi:aminodeoxychorismate/anthranilate synthase component II [Rosenbergiella sp. S61]|uniref:Aminodeoxychorismate/anthranilate synthase component II n=1 Tax=Rosenbergiella gaditana TaxID=2726987 RepID=A0ABS5SUH9_9GAMM|nr:aminodeoxychorismate/anthranilate synthase component II [Rosenbergiella gaditana]MBT0723760.1 aminodeoxychorismate/anthranilate synthase component II [Rosenbergiella gaditana]